MKDLTAESIKRTDAKKRHAKERHAIFDTIKEKMDFRLTSGNYFLSISPSQHVPPFTD